MRRYVYSNLVRIIVISILAAIFIPSSIYTICALSSWGAIHLPSLLIVFLCVMFYACFEMLIHLLNKKSVKGILFESNRIQYQGKTIYLDHVRMRYFTFALSITDPSLVIPKLSINADEFYITCYLSKRDVKRLKRMGYAIQEV